MLLGVHGSQPPPLLPVDIDPVVMPQPVKQSLGHELQSSFASHDPSPQTPPHVQSCAHV